jgi:hypothetical protein
VRVEVTDGTRRGVRVAGVRLAGAMLGGATLGATLTLGVPPALALTPAVSGTQAHWSVVATPRVPHSPYPGLSALTCLTATDCWAVGADPSSTATGSGLIEHRDGAHWVLGRPAPVAARTLVSLKGVACVDGHDCWAVGGWSRSGRDGNLVEHYTGGTSWRRVPVAGSFAELDAVTCLRAGECWAVGSSQGTARSVVTHATVFALLAGKWRPATPARQSGRDVELDGVACAGAGDCLAAGYATPASGAGHALAEHWNGASWSSVSVPGQRSGFSLLAGVTCVRGASHPSCWAVGSTAARPRASSLPVIHPLQEHWNGSRLTSVAGPAGTSGDYPAPAAVACPSGTSCQAVGSRGPGQDVASVFTEGWNAHRWAQEPSTTPTGDFLARLLGVACPGSTDCWAVGEGTTAHGGTVLLYHYGP